MSANLPWPSGAFGDFATFRNGINFSKAQKGEVGIATIDVQNMYGNGAAVRLDRLYKVNKNLDDDHLLKPGDLLFVRSSLKREGVGWTALFTGAPHPISFCGFIIRARLSCKSPFDPLFLTYFFRSDRAREWLVSGSERVAITNISQDVLRRLTVPIPTLDEQRQIAAVLSAVQRAIERQERLIALTAELKKALMHQLFTHGTRREPLKQTEIGPVPGSWDVEPLDRNLLIAQYGLSVKGADDGKTPILRMTNQVDGRIVANDLQMVNIDPSDVTKFKLDPLDILFNRTNSFELVGRTAIFELPGEYVFASYLIRLRTEEAKLRARFLSHYFNWGATQARLKGIASRAVSQSNISASRLRGFAVPFPSAEEQDEVIGCIDGVDRLRSTRLRQLTALQGLFRTLLHQLMTARLRVSELHLSALGIEETAKELAETT